MTEDGTTERIGKIEMTIGNSDSEAKDQPGREDRINALARWLLAQWRLERGEAQN